MIVTIAIAWACAAHAPVTAGLPERDLPWPHEVPADWPTPCFRVLQSGTGYTHTLWRYTERHFNGAAYEIERAESGWPFAAMAWELQTLRGRDSSFGYEGEYAVSFRRGIPLAFHRTHPTAGEWWRGRRLPLQPLPLGFTINALAAAWWCRVLLALWRWQPRVRRGAAAPKWVASVVVVAATINLLVAWSLWLLQQVDATPRAVGTVWVPTTAPVYWPASTPPDWRDAPVWVTWRGQRHCVRSFTLGAGAAPWYGQDPAREVGKQAMFVVQTGWPLVTLQSEETIEAAPMDNSSGVSQPVAAQEWRRRGSPWDIEWPWVPKPTTGTELSPIIPMRPLLYGVAFNTSMYSLAIAYAILIPGAVRTAFRSWRRRCIHCGYAASGLTTCPECGRSPLRSSVGTAGPMSTAPAIPIGP